MNAVFAADAVARLSGTVGVAAVTAGPGNLCIIYQPCHSKVSLKMFAAG